MELQTLRAINKCPNCGAEVPTSSLFCSACGTAMPKTNCNNSQPPEDSVKCNNCGNFVNKNMRFCTSCGTPMQQSTVVVDTPKAEELTPKEAAVEEAPKVVRKCLNCGKNIDGDSVFCEECGIKI